MMNNLKIYITTLVLILSIISCNAQTSLSRLSFNEGKTTIIKNVVDMKGEELVLPKDVTLKFEMGGCLKNGKITGTNTSIVGYKQGIFDGVSITGQWNVPYISTDMFKDVSSVNSLQNVFALASEKIENVITIPEGNYVVAANLNGTTILPVPSNTEVIINGTIIMLPNDFTNYYIVGLKGENIKLHGKGEIVGDKHTHTGTKGEWGMGVNLARCKNVDIYDLTIRDCWGDCIYIGTESTDVRINNCTLNHGRRQGISVTSADGIYIYNCSISKVNGTAPQYGIDIEPNQGETVDNIIIENVEIYNCYGGILTYGKAKNARIGKVLLKECQVYNCLAKYPINFQTGESVVVENCYIEADENSAILFQNIDNVLAENNFLYSSNERPIKIISCKMKDISDNTIVKR